MSLIPKMDNKATALISAYATITRRVKFQLENLKNRIISARMDGIPISAALLGQETALTNLLATISFEKDELLLLSVPEGISAVTVTRCETKHDYKLGGLTSM